MILKKSVTNAIKFLRAPLEHFKKLQKHTLEQILEDYIKLLLGSGILAGLLSVMFAILRALYLETFRGVTVEYLRLFNYSLGTATGIFFFYLFIGTFGMLIVATIVWILIKKIKYYDLIKIFCLSLYPIYLFSWIYIKASPMLLLWSIFLLIIGVKEYKKSIK